MRASEAVPGTEEVFAGTVLYGEVEHPPKHSGVTLEYLLLSVVARIMMLIYLGARVDSKTV